VDKGRENLWSLNLKLPEWHYTTTKIHCTYFWTFTQSGSNTRDIFTQLNIASCCSTIMHNYCARYQYPDSQWTAYVNNACVWCCFKVGKLLSEAHDLLKTPFSNEALFSTKLFQYKGLRRVQYSLKIILTFGNTFCINFDKQYDPKDSHLTIRKVTRWEYLRSVLTDRDRLSVFHMYLRNFFPMWQPCLWNSLRPK
jgi:hypothetical protein